MRLSWLLCLLLCACAGHPARQASGAHEPPRLRLAPEALVAGAWTQEIRIEHQGRRQTLIALLEIDSGLLRLVAFAAEREAFRLFWDGKTLQAQRADWLPQALDPQRVLDDLILATGPLAPLRAGLPPDWVLEEVGHVRSLRTRGMLVTRVRYTPDGYQIDHPAWDLRLYIRQSDPEIGQ